MSSNRIPDYLFGNKAKFCYLFIASCVMLFTLLGARDIWTQEHRWADIVSGMFYRHDFLHPYLGESTYYDKPLMSYWLIAFIAKISGNLNAWCLRLPSALSGLLAIFSIYRLGTYLRNQTLGLLSGWLLLTTFYFVFWARVSSADMLNMAGSLFAVYWYFKTRSNANFYSYFTFFMILCFTSLCKGLVGAIVPLIAVSMDMIVQKNLQSHLRPACFIALSIAVLFYLFPFLASSYVGGDHYQENGLYLVYKENFLRYFKPFDHQGPLYTYFLYLPIYLLPWGILLFPAIFRLFKKPMLSKEIQWLLLTIAVLFLFFTLSGSRRSYYVLPLVPFAILFIADWLLFDDAKHVKKWMGRSIVVTFVLVFAYLDILPGIYYHQVGVATFANKLKAFASGKRWENWHVVMLDADTKLNFYLELPPATKNYPVIGDRTGQTQDLLLDSWPLLKNVPKNTIFISRIRYQDFLTPYFRSYQIVKLQQKWFYLNDADMPVAFIPKA